MSGVQRVGARLEHRGVRTPRLDRVVLVETHRRGHGVPQPVDVGLAEHGLGPTRVGRRDDDPVELAAGNEGQVDRAEVSRLSPGDARGLEPVEEGGLGVAGEGDQRRQRLGPASDPVEDVLRRAAEFLLGAELDRRLAQMEVGDERVNAPGACPQRGTRHGTRDRSVLHEIDEHDLLPELHVRADPHGEVGEPVEALLRRHGGRRYRDAAAKGRSGAARFSAGYSPQSKSRERPRGRRRARRPRPTRPRPATAAAAWARGRRRPRGSPRGGLAPPT